MRRTRKADALRILIAGGLWAVETEAKANLEFVFDVPL